MTKQISSVQNTTVKRIVQLKAKAKERKKHNQFIIEGKRELSLAIKGGYSIESLFYQPDLFSESEAFSLQNYGIEITEITNQVFEKLAHRNSTEGIIAIAKSKAHSLETLQLTNEKPLILVAEAPEKPGNIGALLRTADAANLDAVCIANPKTDLYNPNIIRSSVGCLFTNQIITGSSDEIMYFLKNNDIQILCAALGSSIAYHKANFSGPTAIVVGTEDKGLSKVWTKFSDQNIEIPMSGEIDSMNVSVAAGILIFEAKRQRDFKY